MAVPKRRRTSTSRKMRRSHHFKKPLKLVSCPKCHSAMMSHVACPTCGTYNGREVINVMAALTKKERKAKAKAQQTNQ